MFVTGSFGEVKYCADEMLAQILPSKVWYSDQHRVILLYWKS